MKKLKIFSIIVFALFLISFTQKGKKKLLVIGDSISLAYGPELKLIMESKYDYATKNTNADAGNLDYPTGPNAGDSHMVLNYLKSLAKDKKSHFDLLILNCGLHDIKTNPETGLKAISPNLYRNNLDSIFIIVKKMKLKLIWINTTPVNDSIHNHSQVGFLRFNRDVILYNHIADSICNRQHIRIIDLYNFSKIFPVSAIADHVHFKPEFARLQAAYIAGYLEKIDN